MRVQNVVATFKDLSHSVAPVQPIANCNCVRESSVFVPFRSCIFWGRCSRATSTLRQHSWDQRQNERHAFVHFINLCEFLRMSCDDADPVIPSLVAFTEDNRCLCGISTAQPSDVRTFRMRVCILLRLEIRSPCSPQELYCYSRIVQMTTSNRYQCLRKKVALHDNTLTYTPSYTPCVNVDFGVIGALSSLRKK